MNKMKRIVVGFALGLLTLWMVVPTVNTASADGYSTSGTNAGATVAQYVIGAVTVGGVIDALAAHPPVKHTVTGPQ